MHRVLGGVRHDVDLCASLARLLHASGSPLLPSSGTGVKPLGATVAQTRTSSKVLQALCTAASSGSLASRFVNVPSGFTFLEARVTPDLRRAYILWTAMPGSEARMERELNRSAVPLRNAVAKLTGLRFTPELLFRRQAAHKDELETEAAWLMLEQERLEESAAAAPRETEEKDTKN